MKKLWKIVLVTLSILVLMIAALLTTLLVWAGQMMSPTPTGRITPAIVALKTTMVNAFVIQEGTNAVAIDAGSSPKALLAEIRKTGIDPLTVSHVFFTHSDGDHTGGASIFSNARFFLSAAEAKLARHEIKRRIIGIEKWNDLKVPYSTFRDGDNWKIGSIRVEAVYSPGHTPGSVCYLVNGSDLFTGDLMSMESGKVKVTWDGLNMDSRMSSNSIRMLASRFTNLSRILTAHTGFTFNVRGSLSAWR